MVDEEVAARGESQAISWTYSRYQQSFLGHGAEPEDTIAANTIVAKTHHFHTAP
jgi:hypothetical protein